MKPISIVMEGFKGVQVSTTFTFPQSKGLYMMKGKNERNPAISPNGAGKSTVWDALSWVQYGKTARGLRANDIKNWDTSECAYVAYTLKHRGQVCVIKRTQGPNTLTLQQGDAEPEVVDQDALDAWLGMAYEDFLYTTLHGQFATFFFDLKPAEQIAVLSNALKLRMWDKAAQAASAACKVADQAIRDGDVHKARLIERYDQLCDQYDDYKEQAKAAEQQVQSRVAKLQSKLDALQAEYAELDVEQKQAASKYEDALGRGRAAEDKYSKAKKEKALADEAHRQAQFTINEITIELKVAREEREKLDKLCGGRCPTCKQIVRESSVEQVLQKVDMDIELQERTLDSANTTLEEAAEDCDLWDDRFEKVTHSRDKGRVVCTSLHDAVKALDNKMHRNKGEQRILEDQINDEEGTASTLLDKAAQTKAKAKEVDAELDTLESDMEAQHTHAEHSKYWSREFKNVKLWVLEQGLVQLQAEVNAGIAALGLGGWAVTFAPDRETKKGDIAKGFTCMVTSPGNKKKVPFAAWCGGEVQRLRIAGAVGVANFLRARLGVDCSFEVWDEPTQHLNASGIDALLDYMKQRTVSEDKQLWLVDHRSLGAGEFDGITYAVNTINGIQIRKEL